MVNIILWIDKFLFLNKNESNDAHSNQPNTNQTEYIMLNGKFSINFDRIHTNLTGSHVYGYARQAHKKILNFVGT